MKKVFLALVYVFGLAACFLFRFLQITQMINPETGFLLSQYQYSNYVMYGIAAVFVLVLIMLGVVSDGLPQKRNGSSVIGICSIFLGLTALVMTAQLCLGLKAEIGLLLYIAVSAIFGIYLIYFGYCQIADINIAAGTAVIPVIFSGVRLAIIFLQYYGLAKTVDIVMEIIMLIVSMLFWHYFSKYSIGIKPQTTPRWVVGYSLAASMLCLAVTVPTYYAKFFTTIESVRDIGQTSYFDLATGIYIIIFLIASVCSGKNKKQSIGE